MRYLLSLLLLLFVGCSVSTPPVPSVHEEHAALDDGADAGSWYDALACECRPLVGPYPWGSPIAAFHTEQLGPDGAALPTCNDMASCVANATPLACSSDADCQPDSVKGCRHAGCDMQCGICVFQTYPPCAVDTCTMPGHHSTCVTAADCAPAPYYATDCIEGRCLILPDLSSGFYCAGPGDLRPVGQ